jgi:hypothetical protein
MSGYSFTSLVQFTHRVATMKKSSDSFLRGQVPPIHSLLLADPSAARSEHIFTCYIRSHYHSDFSDGGDPLQRRHPANNLILEI